MYLFKNPPPSPFAKGGLAILPLFGKEGIGEILLNSIIHPSLKGYLKRC